MTWIKSHHSLANHPKLFDLAQKMNWDTSLAIGKLHQFWWWCNDYCEDGDLRKHNSDRIGRAVGLFGSECEKFMEAMISSGWIDEKPYLRIHDWWDYVGRRLYEKYSKEPEKWKKIQDLYRRENIEPTVNLLETCRFPSLEKSREEKSREEKKYVRGKSTRFTPPTLAELEIYCSERKNGVDPQKFLDFYESKGWLIGKNKMKDWKAAIRTWERSNGLDPKTQEKPRISNPTPIGFEIKRLFSAVRVAKDLPKELPGWDEAHFSKESPAAQKLLEFCGGDVILAGRYIIDKGSELKELGLNWTLETILRHAYDSEDLAAKKEIKNVERKQESMGVNPVSGGNANKETPRRGESEGPRSKSAEENRNRINALVSGVVRPISIPDNH